MICKEIEALDKEIEKELEKVSDVAVTYKKKRDEYEKKKLDIERYVLEIPDIRVRMIARYRFIEGMSLQEIGDKMHYSIGRISQICAKLQKGE